MNEDPSPRDTPGTDGPAGVRLSKRMSELGLASRREADAWIERGWVRIDGRVVSELGSRVLEGQRITIDPRARREQADRVTVLMHKPIGYVSGQAEDGHRPARVLVTPERRWRDDQAPIHFHPQHLRSLVPAGRLDIDSTGLLVLTQDGRIAKALIGEATDMEKEYLVRVVPRERRRLSSIDLEPLRFGLSLDGRKLAHAMVEQINDDQLRFVLHEGMKRQIRRMCDLVGLDCIGLKRVRIGALALGALPLGHWRYLGPGETF